MARRNKLRLAIKSIRLFLFLAFSASILSGVAFGASKRILLIPAGEVNSGALYQIKGGIERETGKAVDIGDGMRMPSEARDNYRQQWSSSMILDSLEAYNFWRTMDPKKYERILIVVDVDIFSGGGSVFGQADAARGRAVMSLTRFREEFYGRPKSLGLFYMRIVKEAVRELAYTYGLGACPNKKCVMFASNSFEDIDKKKPSFCANCMRKIKGGK